MFKKGLLIVAALLMMSSMSFAEEMTQQEKELWKKVQVSKRQPNMLKAYDHLIKARALLNKASKNKGGHRKKAIRNLNQTIKHLKQGVAAAEKMRKKNK